MKLTIRQVLTTGPATVEREIYLEESNPLHQVQVMSSQPTQDPSKGQMFEGIDSGIIHLISFPLLEMLISRVFEGEEP